MRADELRVPRDVAAHVNKRRILRVLAFCIIEMALLLVALFYGADIFDGKHPELAYVLYAAVMIAPIFWFDIPFWLFDKSWAGEILTMEEETYNAIDGRARSIGWHINKIQKFTIKLDSGKIKNYTVYDGRSRHAFRKTTYNVGDRVIHVGGTKYLQAVAVSDDDTLICVSCGAESRADSTRCGVCGKTLKIN